MNATQPSPHLLPFDIENRMLRNRDPEDLPSAASEQGTRMKDALPERPIALIVAMAEDRTIAKDGDIPWRVPSDVRRFVKFTKGSPVVMGRKTFDTLKGPLKGRKNLILTTRKSLNGYNGYDGYKDYAVSSSAGSLSELPEGVHSLKEALTKAHAFYKAAPSPVQLYHPDDLSPSFIRGEEIMVIGGAQVYQEFMPQMDRLYLTVIHNSYGGEVLFPEFPGVECGYWNLVQRTSRQREEKDLEESSFFIFERSSFTKETGGEQVVVQQHECKEESRTLAEWFVECVAPSFVSPTPVAPTSVLPPSLSPQRGEEGEGALP